MISHKLEFIYIHIPKTGGDSLSFFLRNHVDDIIKIGKNGKGIDAWCVLTGKGIKHKTIDYYKDLYKDKIKNYFKFTIVRNPYDRILSFYLWSKGFNANRNFDYKNDFDKKDFIEFINRKCSKKKTFQYEFVDDDFYIVKYENMIDDLKQIQCLKNIVNFDNLPRMNTSINSKLNYEDVFDDETKELIYSKFKKDFELFGYEK